MAHIKTFMTCQFVSSFDSYSAFGWNKQALETADLLHGSALSLVVWALPEFVIIGLIFPF